MKNTASLRRRVLDRRAKVVVVGQGYVGLSLACAAALDDFAVMGVDVDCLRVAQLSAGQNSVPGVGEDVFAEAVGSGRLSFSADTTQIASGEVVAITVPTPLRDGTPNLSFVEQACRDVAANLRPGALVILESTTYPGTTDQLVQPALEASGLAAGRDFLLAYSPERIDPGNTAYGLRNTPRVVGGTTPEATGIATLFYEQLVEKVVPVSSCRAAELAKLLENTFRHVNIGLVNELAILCHEMGIDVWEVIEAAASKPFGFMAFQPGPGVGGHCIPLDPTYLSWQVRREVGRHIRILEQAEDVNSQMPAYVVGRIGEAMNEHQMAISGRKIVMLGVSYKPDVGDVRESPALPVLEGLARRGADVVFNDPYVDELDIGGSLLTGVPLSRGLLRSADCVVLFTPHSAYDLDWISAHSRLIFDTRDTLGDRSLAHVVRL